MNFAHLCFNAAYRVVLCFVVALFCLPAQAVKVKNILDISEIGGQSMALAAIRYDQDALLFLSGSRRGTRGLYSTTYTHGQPIALSDYFTHGGVGAASLAYQTDRVLFSNTSEFGSRLYSVPLRGGEPTLITPIVGHPTNGLPFESRYYYQLTVDHESVIVNLDLDRENYRELYRIPITGGVHEKISVPLQTDGRIREFALSRDGQYVVYVAENSIAYGSRALIVAPLEGGPAQRLDVTHPLHETMFEISFDSGHVIYASQSQSQNRSSLNYFSVPIAGGESIQLNHELTDGEVLTCFYSTSLDGQWFAYRLESPTTDIYRVPITGGSAVRVNPPLVGDLDTGNSRCDSQAVRSLFGFTEDSKNIYFYMDELADGRYEYFHYDLVNRTIGKRSGVLNADESIIPGSVLRTKDQQTIIYNVRATGDPARRLYAYHSDHADEPPLFLRSTSLSFSQRILSRDPNLYYFVRDNPATREQGLYRVHLASYDIDEVIPMSETAYYESMFSINLSGQSDQETHLLYRQSETFYSVDIGDTLFCDTF